MEYLGSIGSYVSGPYMVTSRLHCPPGAYFLREIASSGFSSPNLPSNPEKIALCRLSFSGGFGKRHDLRLQWQKSEGLGLGV